ncbi:aldo/keto reductase [Christensenellaceae bacterium OttesenSCG-928-K19]|nr:aldo/keto reductase [Christensenellaceae bacterium OttesenSCG-928-K19]
MAEKTMNSTVTLNNGVQMPIFGLGMYTPNADDDTYMAVRWAIDAGYRLADTASFYENENDLGRAFAESGLAREKFFVATKLWPLDFDNVEQALKKSLTELKMDYVDLYLMHWPGTDAELMKKAWNEMLELMEKGYIKACGISNFYTAQIDTLIKDSGVTPQAQQVELHPWFQQRKMRAYCKEKNIAVTSWGPIFHGHLSEVPEMGEIGAKYGKSAAQATLRGMCSMALTSFQNRCIKTGLLKTRRSLILSWMRVICNGSTQWMGKVVLICSIRGCMRARSRLQHFRPA